MYAIRSYYAGSFWVEGTMEIRIKGLTRDFYSEGKRIRALDHVDLTIPANRIFTLLGPSGCGKTTLLSYNFV